MEITQYVKNLWADFYKSLTELYDFTYAFLEMTITGEGISGSTQFSLMVMLSLIIMNVMHYGVDAYVRAKVRTDTES